MSAYLELLEKKPFSLIMSLPANDPALAKAAFTAGADVVKVHVNLEHRGSGNRFGTLADNRATFKALLAEASGPVGIVPGQDPAVVRGEWAALSTLPFSFVSLYASHIPADAMRGPLPMMVACDYSFTEGEIAAYGAMGASVVEASIVRPEDYRKPLTFRDLADYRRICTATDLPVVVPTQKAILPGEVGLLKQAGARAVMIGAVVTGESADSIAAAVGDFRRVIDAL